MKLHPLMGQAVLVLAVSAGIVPAAPAQQAATPTVPAEPVQTSSEPQAEAPASAAPADSGGIEEIVVTAQRREQKLQDVPISVSAVTAETLEAMGINATDDLSSVSPGLLLTRSQGALTPNLRGIGVSTVTGGQESPVSLYVDGFYIPQLTAINFSFNNIERVEVLKGPQGTLFGRNATGGLIQIVTRDPSHQTDVKIGASYDNFDTLESSLYATTGISDNLAADLAVFVADQGEGYGDNVTTGKETGKRRETGLRSTWLLSAGEATTARLSFDYVDSRSSIGIGRHAAEGARGADGVGPLPDFWDIRSNYEPRYDLESYGVGLKITHDFGDLRFVSLTGARYGDSLAHIDQDSTPIALVDAILSDENKTFSQELQLQSNGTGPLSWIAGLYFFKFDVDAQLTTAGAALTPLGGSQVQSADFDTTSYSGYAQATYALSDATNVTAGFRYTEDRREFEGLNVFGNGTQSSALADPKQNEGRPTWRLSVDHRFSPQLMTFASYNRGFKSGVYNTTNINNQPVDSETVDAYEVGIKTDLLDRRLRINAAGFFYDYTDMQVTSVNAGTVSLSNAAKAEIYGAEIEIVAMPTEHLNLMLGLAWLDAEYKSFPGAQITEQKPAPAGGNYQCAVGQTTPTGPTGACPEDVRQRLSAMSVAGNDVIRAPNFSGSLSARYSIPSSLGEFAVAAAYIYTGDFYFEPDNRVKQDAYGLVNGQLEWTHTSGRYRAYLFGKNLTDEEYTQFLSTGALGDLLAPQPPRTFGVGGEVRF